MKKTITEKETNQILQSNPIAELQEKIKDIRSKGEEKSFIRDKNIAEAVISYLKSCSNFIKTDTWLYIFERKEKILYEFWSSECKYLFHNITWINPAHSPFTPLMKEVELEIVKNGVPTDIRKFSHYDKNKNILYVYDNNHSIVKITTSNISVIDNGDDGHMFLKKSNHEKWEYNESVKHTWFLREFVDGINFEETELDQSREILYGYILSLFFGNMFNAKPVLILFGERRSGKSYIFQRISQVFFGNKTNISTLPSKELDLKANLANSPMCFYDNVDSEVKNSHIDILCSVATGTAIKIRKLYSNMDEIEKSIECFLGFTCREMTLKRDDIVDRSIILNLVPREENNIDSVIEKNRSEIMSELCFELQSVLKKIVEGENHKMSFRMVEFGNFFINSMDDKKRWKEILERLVDSQKKVLSQITTDVEMIAFFIGLLFNDTTKSVEYGFIKSNKYTAKDLMNIFTRCAVDNDMDFILGNSKSLGKKLSDNEVCRYIASSSGVNVYSSSWVGGTNRYQFIKR